MQEMRDDTVAMLLFCAAFTLFLGVVAYSITVNGSPEIRELVAHFNQMIVENSVTLGLPEQP
jgi:hypothetical protein